MEEALIIVLMVMFWPAWPETVAEVCAADFTTPGRGSHRPRHAVILKEPLFKTDIPNCPVWIFSTSTFQRHRCHFLVNQA